MKYAFSPTTAIIVSMFHHVHKESDLSTSWKCAKISQLQQWSRSMNSFHQFIIDSKCADLIKLNFARFNDLTSFYNYLEMQALWRALKFGRSAWICPLTLLTLLVSSSFCLFAHSRQTSCPGQNIPKRLTFKMTHFDIQRIRTGHK